MSDEFNLQLFTLTSIAHRCAQETDNFFHSQSHDPRYGFELFRRAIIDQNQHAWEIIYAQYRSLVEGWVQRHPAFEASGEEAQYFVNGAFEKLWTSVTANKFGGFPDLKSVLRYLQMCVHSCIVDHVRMAEPAALDVQAEASADEGGAPGSTIEDQVLDQVQRQELWHSLNARLHDEKERQVMYGSLILALRPRELYARFQETFRDVDDVYRVKQNVLARLRRDSEIKKLLNGGG